MQGYLVGVCDWVTSGENNRSGCITLAERMSNKMGSFQAKVGVPEAGGAVILSEVGTGARYDQDVVKFATAAAAKGHTVDLLQ